MTCKRWYMIGTAIAPRAACALLLLGGVAGTAAAAENGANEYAQVLADADSLQRYNASIEQLMKSQEADIASLNEQINGLDAVAAQVEPLLEKMYNNLSQFVASDLPFLTKERTERMDKLQDVMAEDKNYGEKFRRIMEAYQIEIEYGRSMKAYRGKLADGREADFIHLGRVSLMYQTVDGTESGYWDAKNSKWVVDPRYSRAINDALKMAKEETASDLTTLPVPAAAETHS